MSMTITSEGNQETNINKTKQKVQAMMWMITKMYVHLSRTQCVCQTKKKANTTVMFYSKASKSHQKTQVFKDSGKINVWHV